MGWRFGRCQHVQVSDLLSMEMFDKAVVDFLAASDIRKFTSKPGGGDVADGQQVEK